MSDKIKLLIIEGTNRDGRRSIHVAKLLLGLAGEIEDYEVRFVDPKDYKFYPDDAKDPRYSEVTAWADAFFIVTPEYNHGYPGSLKTMLDSELANYKLKPVYLAGVSDGIFGGARAIHALLPSLRRMGMVLGPKDLIFPRVQDTFDENGKLLDETKIESAKTALNELLQMAKLLKPGRPE